jgi:hypothetical protein
MSILDKIWEWSIMGNSWLWFHMGGGAVGARIGMCFFDSNEVAIVMFLLIILWEIIEVFYEGIDGLIKIYGSLERWFYDSLGDVLGAMIMVLLITY